MNHEQRFRQLVDVILNPKRGITLNEAAWEEVIHLSREADLLGTLCALAEAAGVLQDYSPYAQRHLESMKRYSERQAQQVIYECGLIDQQLREAGIAPVFLKGAGYTLRGSRNSRGRIYSDIDVLVRWAELDRAQATLQRNAWYTPAINNYDERYYREWAHEIPPMRHLTRRTVIDLHHNIVPPITGRAPEIGHLLAAVTDTADGVRVLSPAAAVLHSAVHLLNNEDLSHGFRDLLDLYLLFEEYGDQTFRRDLRKLAEKTGFTRELLQAVALLEYTFGCRGEDIIGLELRDALIPIRNSFNLRRVLAPAMRPHHPLVCSAKEWVAIHLAYLRGHWIKMPLPVLVGHLSIKAGMGIGKKLFGKHKPAAILE